MPKKITSSTDSEAVNFQMRTISCADPIGAVLHYVSKMYHCSTNGAEIPVQEEEIVRCFNMLAWRKAIREASMK